MLSHRQLIPTIGIFALCTVSVLLSGCYIASIHPVAEPNQRIYDKELVGVWVSGKDTLRISGETVDNLTFDITEGPSALSDSARSGSLNLILTNVNDQTFMDVRPAEIQDTKSPILEQMLLVPLHGVIRYVVHKDTLSIQYLNYTEVRRMLETGKLHGLDVESVADDGPLVITSSTTKLRDFLSDNKKNDQLYADPINYVKVKA
jgi:hypothetical protein